MTLSRHIDACTNAALPGRRRPLVLAGARIGWVLPEVLAQAPPGGLPDAAALGRLADGLAHAGSFVPRHELFDVRATPDGPVLGTVDRGALPVLGIAARGVHLNGLVRRDGGVWVWVGRRAADKKLDPGKLDHLVAGGVPAGLSARETLIKEAAEEAGLPPSLTAQARHVATIGYAMERDEGLRRDLIECYDLDLPGSFAPTPIDGEVAGFELWPVMDVLDRVRRTDDFKFNVNLVLIDLFLRLGLLPDGEPAMARVYISGGAASIGISRVSPG